MPADGVTSAAVAFEDLCTIRSRNLAAHALGYTTMRQSASFHAWLASRFKFDRSSRS